MSKGVWVRALLALTFWAITAWYYNIGWVAQGEEQKLRAERLAELASADDRRDTTATVDSVSYRMADSDSAAELRNRERGRLVELTKWEGPTKFILAGLLTLSGACMVLSLFGSLVIAHKKGHEAARRFATGQLTIGALSSVPALLTLLIVVIR